MKWGVVEMSWLEVGIILALMAAVLWPAGKRFRRRGGAPGPKGKGFWKKWKGKFHRVEAINLPAEDDAAFGQEEFSPVRVGRSRRPYRGSRRPGARARVI